MNMQIFLNLTLEKGRDVNWCLLIPNADSRQVMQDKPVPGAVEALIRSLPPAWSFSSLHFRSFVARSC